MKAKWQERVGGASGYSTNCLGAETSPTAFPGQYQVGSTVLLYCMACSSLLGMVHASEILRSLLLSGSETGQLQGAVICLRQLGPIGHCCMLNDILSCEVWKFQCGLWYIQTPPSSTPLQQHC